MSRLPANQTKWSLIMQRVFKWTDSCTACWRTEGNLGCKSKTSSGVKQNSHTLEVDCFLACMAHLIVSGKRARSM